MYDPLVMSAYPASPSSGSNVVIELPERTATCIVGGCAGIIVRHSLGSGQAVDRCTRCFRRYRLSRRAETPAVEKGRLRRFLDDFVAWKD